MNKVTKAIIPAGGLGTRVLPASKAIPKEMLQIVDKPAIQYIVEEAVAAGITDILVITNRGKSIIEDHFDKSYELECLLEAKGKTGPLEEIRKISDLASMCYIRQKEAKGLGHAIMCAKTFAAGDPVAILYGDDVIIGEDPAIGQLCRAYEKYGRGVVGVKEVSEEAIQKYSSLQVENIEGNVYKVTDMIEKPSKDEIMSLFSILGRCVLPYDIFEILENTAPGAGNEIQLTDAMKTLARRDTMVAVDFTGTRYDMGNKLGIMQANCEVALKHPEIGGDFRQYILELAEKIK